MAKSVPVRCPECRREHTYTPPVYPCVCGAPVTLPLQRDGLPAQVRHRTWSGSWVEVHCPVCGVAEEWPQPELGCGCGAMLRLPVAPSDPGPDAGLEAAPELEPSPGPETSPDAEPGLPGAGGAGRLPSPGAGSGGGCAATAPRTAQGPGDAPPSRPAFSPVTIRTAQDARTAAAQYLRWLGFAGVRVTEKRPASGVDLRGPGIVAHVDPSTAPTTLRDVETLWLHGLNETALTACFSLAGYAREARSRADTLCVPLFVLDLTGMPQAVNDPADDLVRSVC